MNKLWSKKHCISGKALLLLGVYLLHFVLFQSVVIGLSDSHQGAIKSFFSGQKKKTNPNSGIATFRTLEKHEASHWAFKFPSDFYTYARCFDMLVIIDRSISQPHIPNSFHRPDTSYRLYAKDGVFRI